MLTKLFVATLAIYYESIVSNSRIMVLATKASDRPCTSKHQMGLEKPSFVFAQNMEPIEFFNFDKMPSETILENDGYMLLIHLMYNGTGPAIKVNFQTSLGYQDTYHLQFLYFQWFEEVPSALVFENITFPGEFLAYFYNKKAISYEHAYAMDKGIVILSFAVEVNTSATYPFDVLQGHLLHVRKHYTKTSIPNRNLEYWLRSDMKEFYLYEGAFRYYCMGKVAYVDYTDVLRMSPDIVKEFEELEAWDMQPLMTNVINAVKPNGQVYTNSVNGNGPPTNRATGVLLIFCCFFLIFYQLELHLN